MFKNKPSKICLMHAALMWHFEQRKTCVYLHDNIRRSFFVLNTN